MTAQTLANYDEFLKTGYRDFLQSAIPRGSKLTQMIRSRGKKITAGGKSMQITWSNHKALAWRGQHLAEAGDLAPPGYLEAAEFVVGLADRSHTFQLNGRLLVSGTSRDFAYQRKRALNKHIRAIKDEASFTQQIFDNNDGTANLGETASYAANVFTMVAGTNMNRFQRGMHIEAYAASSGGSNLLGGVDQGRIVEVDHGALTIEVANGTGATVGGGDFIALAGYRDLDVPEGIVSLVSDAGTVQGIDRSVAGNGWAKSQVIDNGGVAATYLDIQELVDVVRQRGFNTETAEAFYTNYDDRRKLFDLFQGQTRYNNDVTNLYGGIKAIAFHNGDKLVPVVADNYAPLSIGEGGARETGVVYYIDVSSWGNAMPEGKDPAGYWNNEDGRILARSTGSSSSYKDAWEGTWLIRMNNTVDDFSCQGLLKDFT